MSVNSQELQKVIEMVYVLAGSRGDRNKSALLRGELANLQEFIAKLTRGAKVLESQLNVINDDVVQAKHDINEQKTALAELAQGLEVVKEGLVSAQNAVDQLNSDLAAAQQHIDSIAEGSSTATQDLATLKQQTGAVATPSPTQGAVTAPPDAAQFNQVVSDLAAAMQAIAAIKNAVST